MLACDSVRVTVRDSRWERLAVRTAVSSFSTVSSAFAFAAAE